MSYKSKFPALCAAALACLAIRASAAADVECVPRYWIERTLAVVVKYQHTPLRAARSLSYVAVGLDQAAAEAGAAGLQREIAQHAVSGALLDYLYPYEIPGAYRALARFHANALAARNAGGPSVAQSARVEDLANKLIARALHDGADRRWNPANRPADGPGRWRAAPPLNLYAPIEPLAGFWRTWVIADPALLSVRAPPRYGSTEYWSEVDEVWETSLRLSPEQKALADEWHLDQGSVTPAGVWNRKVLELLPRTHCDPGEAARVLAAVNVAMYDALVAAWHVKYTYWTLRPVNAVREKYDPHFLPYLITPPFPSYVSGHASVSGAAAEVLSHFFPEQAEVLGAMAQAAADSRLYGGIHFRSDNEEGLRLGRQVGRAVVERLRGDRDKVRWY